MLKKVINNYKKLSKEDNNSKNLDPLETSSDKEFQLVKNLEIK